MWFADTGVKHYPDRSINAGTRAVYDAGAGSEYGTGQIYRRGAVKSLTFADSVASFSKAHAYAGGGMVLPG